MEEKRKLLGYYNYTVVLTYVGMLIGFTGVTFAVENKIGQAVLCLMFSGICDMFDGTIASTRERNSREKGFGIQIDSLSDLICFGVLPAMIVYMANNKGYITYLVACAYVLCALIRLAYFNVLEAERQTVEEGSRKTYMGLPVTAIALILPACYLVIRRWFIDAPAIYTGMLLVVAALFISPIKIKKPYLVGKIGIICTGIVELIIMIMRMGI
jgi:CDP-diacylglycerol--serine O-phosphatidyltransferase